MESTEEDQEIFEIICKKLDLSHSATIIEEPIFEETWSPVEVDLVIEDGVKRFIVEIKSRVKVDTIARLVLLKELLQKQNKNVSDNFFVAAGKVFPPDVEKLAKWMDIKLVTIPYNVRYQINKYDYFPGKTKVTSEKSWKIITRLLKEKMTSIRQLSIMENVSYGWAHATVKNLIAQGIVTKKGNYVSITDINKLLNGVAWERPFENLLAGEINIEYHDAFKAAQELSIILKNNGIKFAFTSYTAGGLYTGYALRHDSVYLYIEKNDVDFFKKMFENPEKKGIKARIYAPDRELFNNTKDIEGVRLVSPAQALLDLAGLGYSGRDITKAVVEKYASL
jgi:DNA-binding Lrp family transcriptional regulator